MKKISVIIPTRNRKRYLESLLIDLEAQTLTPYEIIIVDQSSDPYHLDKCKYFHLNSIGPSIARNYGIKNSSGEIIVFLDDDVHIEADFIQRLVLPILQGKSFVSCGAVCDKFGNYLKHEIGNWENRGNSLLKVITANPDHPYDQYCFSFPTGCAAISRDVLLHVGCFDEFFDPNGAGEDREMALRLLRNGYSIYYTGSAKSWHLVASYGGRRDIGISSALLDANIGYIIFRHFGSRQYKIYKSTILLLGMRNLARGVLHFRAITASIRYLRAVLYRFSAIESKLEQ